MKQVELAGYKADRFKYSAAGEAATKRQGE
jgi:hypothetical protein